MTASAVAYRRRRRRKKRPQDEVELNLAAMLDMAFQLLAFFVLTFRPSPVEGQISLRLPPPQGLMGGTQQAGDTPGDEIPKGLNTFVLSVVAKPDGSIDSMTIGEGTVVPNLTRLNRELQTQFADDANPFNQVLLQVDGKLRYEELLKVIDVCTQQTILDADRGKRVPLSKLSFVEMGGQG